MSKTSNICPSGKEFQELVKHPDIGLFQAMKDWMENDGKVRTPDQILNKLKMTEDPTYIPSDMEGLSFADSRFDSLEEKEAYDEKQKEVAQAINELTQIDMSFQHKLALLTRVEDVTDPVYTGLFVDTIQLQEMFPPVHENVYGEHVTLTYMPEWSEVLEDFNMGKVESIKITGRLTTDQIDVLTVEIESKTNNKQAHITLSTKGDVRPFHSNMALNKHADRIKPIEGTQINGTKGVFDGNLGKSLTSRPSPQDWKDASNTYASFRMSTNSDKELGSDEDLIDFADHLRFNRPSASFMRTSEDIHRDALETLDNKIRLSGYDITNWGIIGTGQRLSEYDINKIQRMIDNSFAPEEWKLRKSRIGNWYIAGYKNQNVFSEDYYSPEVRYVREDTNTVEGLEQQHRENMVDTPYDIDRRRQVQAKEATTKLLKMLSDKLGVEYQVIKAEEAQNILESTSTPWRGEKAFFFEGTIYFVGDSIRESSVIHEFSHPLIRGIAYQNPELFDNLFKELQESEDGKEIIEMVKSRYPELEEGGRRFKEEVIVTAMEYNFLSEDKSTGFKSFINNVIEAIKKVIKSLFSNNSKISLSTLSPTTTVSELTGMLLSSQEFEIESSVVSQEEMAAFEKDLDNQIRNQTEEIELLKKVGSTEKGRQDLIQLSTQGFKAVVRSLNVMRRDKNYEEMAKVLADQFGMNNLQEIMKNLNKYTDRIEKRIGVIVDDAQYAANHVEALVNTYFRVGAMLNDISKHLRAMEKLTDITPEDVMKVHSYKKVIDYWSTFSEFTKDRLISNGIIDSRNPMTELLGTIDGSIRTATEAINKINAKGSKAALLSVLMPMSNNMRDIFNTTLDMYIRRKAPRFMIDRLYKEFYGLTEAEHTKMQELENKGLEYLDEYEELKQKSFDGVRITPEKIDALLEGSLDEGNVTSHWANSFFEGYMYQTDPIVGGLSVFVKEAVDNVHVNAQSKYNNFAKVMVPLLNKIGYSPSNIGELGKLVGFIDIIGLNDENGNLQEKEVWTFLNPWKDYRYVQDKLKNDLEKARQQHARTGNDKDGVKVKEAVKAMQDHNIKYMHQEIAPEYYKMREAMNEDPIGSIALQQRDLILEDIRSLQERSLGVSDEMDIDKAIESFWNKYRKLHSLYDNDGNMKEGEDLAVAKKLQEYRKESREFYDLKIRQGSFENALVRYDQHLRNTEPDPEVRENRRAEWIRKNTRVVIKDEFYERRDQIQSRIRELMDKIPDNTDFDPQTGEEKNISELVQDGYDTIFDAISGFRDEDGQPNGTSMGSGRLKLVKNSQDLIEKWKENTLKASGLTKAQEQRKFELIEKDKVGGLNQNDLQELESLKNKKPFLKKIERKELTSLFRELEELSYSEPTPYYLDILNDFLSDIDSPKLVKRFGTNTLDVRTANELLDPGNKTILRELFKKSPEFKKWFQANHVEREKYIPKLGETEDVWNRTYAWSIIRPRQEEYYEKYDLKNSNGEIIETVDGLPAMKYYTREVKDEYKTGYNASTGKIQLKTGVHVDNRGSWLPRADVVNSPYRNEKYYQLKNDNPDLFNVLEKLKEFHIQHQDGLSYREKLYYDFPRYERPTLEIARNKGALKGYLYRIKQFFTGSKDAPESGYKHTDDFVMASLDIFTDENEHRVPIHGLYDIDSKDVSTDITNGMLRYMMSAERNKELTRIHPLAQAIKETVQKGGYRGVAEMAGRSIANGGSVERTKDKHRKIRSNTIQEFIEREFHGETQAGFGSDSQTIHNISSGIFQLASFSFFALNIPSALKNSLGAKLQSFIEASAGRYFNMKDFGYGEAWATRTMGEVSAQIYKHGPKSVNVQIWELLDPLNMYGEKSRREGMSRTFLKDMTDPKGIALNFRKWTEYQSSMQMMAAVMHGVKVEKDGKKIPWIEAWEVGEDGRIKLKDGIDPTWGVTYDSKGNVKIGEKFLAKKREMEAIVRNLQGAYDSFNQPRAQRYLAFRFISYLRRYFTTMFIDRFGFRWKNRTVQPRFQPGLGTTAEGFYITIIKYITDVFRSPGRFAFMTPTERRAFMKTGVDTAIMYAIALLQSAVFGWDPDDDEKYEKLRLKSGAAPFPFVTEDEYEYNFGGWMSNHALSLLFQIKSEQQQFILGRNYKDMTVDLGASPAFGPTLTAGYSLSQDLLWMTMGSERAYYKREVGPYNWQQAEGAKFANHLFKALGLTGSTMDPVISIKNYQTLEELGMAR